MAVTAELRFVEATDIEIGGIRRVVGVTRVKDLISLITIATLDSNPRKPKRNDITESICKELRSQDFLFTYKTRGLLVGSANAIPVDSHKFRLEIEDQQIEGILDGGHNTLAIGLVILEAATGRPSEIGRIQDWKEFKQNWLENINAISTWAKSAELGTFHDMLIGLEFILPIDVESKDSVDLFKRSIIDICSARNTSTPLKTSTMLGKLGLLDPLKQRLVEPYLSRVQWEQNGQGVVKSDDLISMTLVPFKALLRYFTIENKSGRAMTVKAGNSLYAGRTAGVRNYGELMQSDKITKRTNDYKREIFGSEIESVFDLAAQLPEIYDRIYSLFQEAFDKNSDRSLMGLPSIVEWNTRHRAHLRLPYSGEEIPGVFPEALIQPILRGLEYLIGFDRQKNRLYWTREPISFIEAHIDEIVKPIPKAFIETYNCAPDLFGKDKHSVVYENVYAQFRRFV